MNFISPHKCAQHGASVADGLPTSHTQSRPFAFAGWQIFLRQRVVEEHAGGPPALLRMVAVRQYFFLALERGAFMVV